MRPSAEIYYDSAVSYTGLCAPSSDSQGAKLLRAGFAALATDSGKENVDCYATAQAYAISAKIPTGQYFCVDSTGRAKVIAGKITKTSCE